MHGGTDDKVAASDILIILFAFWVLLRIWGFLGGWPIAWWRLTGKRGFTQLIVEQDGNISINPKPWKDLKAGSPMGFENRGSWWFAGGPEETGMRKGFPAWLFSHDDSRPMNIRKRDGQRAPPEVIIRAWKNDRITQLNTIGQNRPFKVQMGAALILIVFTLLLTTLSIYYSYNAACAAHSPVCIAVGR